MYGDTSLIMSKREENEKKKMAPSQKGFYDESLNLLLQDGTGNQ